MLSDIALCICSDGYDQLDFYSVCSSRNLSIDHKIIECLCEIVPRFGVLQIGGGGDKCTSHLTGMESD